MKLRAAKNPSVEVSKLLKQDSLSLGVLRVCPSLLPGTLSHFLPSYSLVTQKHTSWALFFMVLHARVYFLFLQDSYLPRHRGNLDGPCSLGL